MKNNPERRTLWKRFIETALVGVALVQLVLRSRGQKVKESPVFPSNDRQSESRIKRQEEAAPPQPLIPNSANLGIKKNSVEFVLRDRWQLTISVIGLILVLLQVVILWRQTGVMKRQADIADFQGRLLEKQTEVIEDQRHMALRPKIYAEVLAENPSASDRTGPWVIHNNGEYQVRNLSITFLLFTKFINRGWRVMTPTGGPRRAELAAGDSWSIDLKWLNSLVENTTPKGLIPAEGLEFLVLMLQFERDIDGKRYTYLEPFHVAGGPPRAMAGYAGSGPLARICAPEVELVFEYFKRRPLENPYEIYNYNYLLGYAPTGCLGPVEWLDNR